jgi:hypothetical protein
MNVFFFVVYVLGALVLAVIVAVFASFIVYTIAFLIALIIVLVRKRVFDILNHSQYQFTQHSKDTNYRTNSRRNTQYVKYYIDNYFHLLWRHNRITDAIFNNLQRTAYRYRDEKSKQYILNLTQIPLDEQSLNGIHPDKSIISDDTKTTKRELYPDNRTNVLFCQ